MAILWQSSLVPFIDPNGSPYSGAKAFFFNAATTTPRTVYRDSGLGEAHDHPVVANASGMFPAVFLPPGDYRLRLEDADGVTIWDIDGISTPSTGGGGGGGGGDTPDDRLNQTGDYKWRHDIGSHTGWVRAAGRTIGAAASGAAERANDDCEDLFLHLWSVDSTLAVSGGRGANAASDWAAAKTIALPDMRLRGFIGMASMGSTVSTLIAAASFDGGEDGDDLGATVGAATVTLTKDQMPVHDHDATSSTEGAHRHTYNNWPLNSSRGSGGGQPVSGANTTENTSTAGAHDHDITVEEEGGGLPHTNVQPVAVATCYMKL